MSGTTERDVERAAMSAWDAASRHATAEAGALVHWLLLAIDSGDVAIPERSIVACGVERCRTALAAERAARAAWRAAYEARGPLEEEPPDAA